jgi:4'-phosphopantetheinyl transferase
MNAAVLPCPVPPPQALAADEIHLWFCEFPPGGAQRGRAQAVLLQLLSAYLDRAVAAQDLVIGAHGKPALPGTALGFNLSHSGAAAVVALAADLELGVDLEKPGRPRAHVELARRYFCPAEADAVAQAGEAQREALFLHLWTAKEAVLKALGRGIAFGLQRLEFDAQSRPARLLAIAAEAGTAADWQLLALPLPAPWLGHLAWRGAPRRLRIFQLPAALVS